MHPLLIKAHLRIAGKSVSKVARELRLSHSTVHTVIAGKGQSNRVATYISDLLAVPKHELWPTVYPAPKKTGRARTAAAR